MRVLGIDPGFATTGYAVVERVDGRMAPVTVGAVVTPSNLPTAARSAARSRAPPAS